MSKQLIGAVVLTLLPGVGQAQFEGIVESKINVTMEGQTGLGGSTATLYRGKAGSRMEMDMKAGMGAFKMTTLVLAARPGFAYLLNESAKTYVEIDTAKNEKPTAASSERFTVKKLGREKVSGFDCVHVGLTSDKGDEYEIWSTRDLGSAADYWLSQRSAAQDRTPMVRALREGGADGWPLKFLHRSGGVSTSWEVIRVERKAVPASLFDLAGYKKSEDGGMMGAMGGGQLSPEQKKRMDGARKQQEEAMKNMTPEQRKQFEEMMKKMKGATGENPRN